MRMSKGLIAALLVTALATAGIVRAIVNQRAEQARITQTDQASVGTLVLQPSDVTQARVAVLVKSVAVSGSIQAVRSVSIKARVPGEVTLVTAREGMSVKAGQLLIQLDARELQSRRNQAAQQAAAAKAQLDIAQRTLDNNQALVNQGFISRNALDTALSNVAAAKATWMAMQSAVELADKALADTRLVTPLGGQVAKQHVQVGERVNVDARLLDVVDLSKLEMQASLRAEDVAALKPGVNGHVMVDGLPQSVAVQVARINPSTVAGTRAVTVYLSVAPHPALRQGLFAKGHLELGRQEGLLLPRTSVKRRPEGLFVQVVRQGKVQHQAVRLGDEGTLGGDPTQAMVKVLEGVQPGETVLKESLGLVKEGSVVQMSPRKG